MDPQIRAVARIAGAMVVLVALAAPARSQSDATPSVIDRFVGTWQEDESKRKIGSLASLIFRRNSAGELEELRGSEARPVVQQVMLDGKQRATDVEGRVFAWKQNTPSTFERVMTEKGRVVNTRRLRISADGKTLTQETEQETTDGRKRVTTTVYQRTSGDASGLVGRWRPQSVKNSLPGSVKYERAGPNALKFANSSNGNTYVVALDDKPVPVNGPAVINGTMIAAKQADDRTIETTSSRDGVVTGRSKRTLSADGRTMTVTATAVGPNAPTEPSVNVYVKQ